MKSRLNWLSVIALLAMLILSAACASSSPETPGASQPEPAQALTVKSVEVVIMESFPVQINVVVKGDLPDDCTQIAPVDPQRDEAAKTFRILLTMLRAQGEACGKTPVPFEETLPLDVVDLPDGAYTVDVNGKQATFTLDVDNTLSQGDDAAPVGMPNPASVFCEKQGYRLGMRTNADGGQYGVCAFPDLTECEEWAFFRGECQMGVDLTSWVEYTNPQYGFALRRPPDWALEEIQGPDNTMAGHQVKLYIRPEANREIEMIISFKRVGEDQLIWPTGVGNGEFFDKGLAWLMAESVTRHVLVCDGRDMSVYYQQEGGVRRGDLEFALILGYVGNCTDGYSIPVEIQSLADAVVATFALLP